MEKKQEKETMRIIISPAKKMLVDCDSLPVGKQPCFLAEARQLKERMQKLTYAEAKEVWQCNDKIAELNYRRFQNMDLDRNLTPAILAYEGIQYQYMAPAVLEQGALDYLEEHLRILSGFYGVLRPFDGIVPYRLEMQAKFKDEPRSLYSFWGAKLAEEVCRGISAVINLASEEYGKCITAHLPEGVAVIDVVFGELIDGRVKEKGTYAKMARGEMVRFMAESGVVSVEEIKAFNRLGYCYSDSWSAAGKIVFLKGNDDQEEKTWK